MVSEEFLERVKQAFCDHPGPNGLNFFELMEITGEHDITNIFIAIGELRAKLAPVQRTNGRDPETGCPNPFPVSYVLPQ